MTYQGVVLPVADLVRRAQARPVHEHTRDTRGVIHTAAANAAQARALLEAGDTETDLRRFVILQTLDHYRSTLRRAGTATAARLFQEEPAPTGSEHIDAAFAALAQYLANRDDWPAPPWTQDPTRTTAHWYPDVPDLFRGEAQRESPPAFRDRGIFITTRSLERA